MNSRIQGAMAQALSRLKSSDVAGATAAIRQALSGGAPGGEEQSPSATRRGDAAGTPPRGLGDVLKALGAFRRSHAPVPPASGRRAVDADGDRFSARRHMSRAGQLAYKLYVPADRDRDLALVLMLHGCTQDPDDFARGTRMNRLADEFGLIVAYPHQPRSANAQGCWNWFDGRHQQADKGEPAMLAALAHDLAAEFGIASDRVFAAGLSAGAAMAEILAETHPAQFAAVGLHSGLPYRAAHDVMSAFAAMKGTVKAAAPGAGACVRKFIVHGTGDATVAPSNGAELFEQMRLRHRDASIVVSDLAQGHKRATRQSLIAASGEPLAEYLLIEGAGHAWSGGSSDGTFADSTGPDASREMIAFFLR